ncbi:uncharacterized protein LOC134876725 isoform X3 [Eleginops maclovinus]|uniref:uncharacterized protein LOC134876725 isoform X3 n=1 Tax=Eleginops maclovinus TaxID=56733 RepID=UPI0030800819
MAISKICLSIFALLLTLTILETGNFSESPGQVLPNHNDEESFLPHTRGKRSVATNQWNYTLDIELNASDVAIIQQFQSSFNSFPIQLDNNTAISDITFTTVCSLTATGFQCRCEDNFAWPYSTCVTYGACDSIVNGICKCIDAIPADGQSCQGISGLLAQVEYDVDVQLNFTDIETLDALRSILDNGDFSLALGPTVNVTHVNISTVCYPNGTNFQCRCEEQYVWSYRNCITYGACDDIIDNTCGCINSIPTNGQYCVPQTVTPVFYEYQISIEVITSDADQLRNAVNSLTLPVQISSLVNILDVNITTVCSQDNTGFQCRCENDYLWPCDKCDTYGKCDGNTSNTCGCINAIPPEGQYCQSADQYNLTACPLKTTPSPTTLLTTTTSPTTLLTTTPSPTSLLTTTPSPTTPPVLFDYIIYVEFKTADVTLINELRTFLGLIIYPFTINQTQVSDVNISTVCSPSIGGYQCRCEDQYRWSCDHCLLYGSCDNITGDTCGCINALPPDGQYCQPSDQNNSTACPLTTTPSPISLLTTTPSPTTLLTTTPSPTTLLTTTPSPTSLLTTTPSPTTPPVLFDYIIYVEFKTADVTLINELRTFLGLIIYPFTINQTQVSDVNISTVCSPSIGGYQCRCEDQYRWSCDHCLLYGSCDNITGDTCGCINALPPDGQYCQPSDQNNSTACPLTTTPSPTTLLTTTPSPTTLLTTTPSPTTLLTTTPSPTSLLTTTPSPTTPPVLFDYIIYVEFKTADVTLINELRTFLGLIIYPFTINQTQVSDVNISTVCSPSIGGYQCRCEDQYRWSCDHCLLYGSCDNITGDTCGCINALPPDGQYCQPSDQNKFTACPLTTTAPPPTTPPPTTIIHNTSTPAPTTALTTAATTKASTNMTTTAATTKASTNMTTTAATTKASTNMTTTAATTKASTNLTTTAATTKASTNMTTTAATTKASTNLTTTTATTKASTNVTTTAATTKASTNMTTTAATTKASTNMTTTAATTKASTNLTTTAATTKASTNMTTTAATTKASTNLTTTAATTKVTANFPPTVVTTTASTLPARTTSTIRTTKKTTTPTVATIAPPVKGLNLAMAVTLNKTFTPTLNDPSSDEYKNLKKDIDEVLNRQYSRITGFISVSVTGFRQGSIITEFVVETTDIKTSEVAEANKAFSKAIEFIAPVIGSVRALYTSDVSLGFTSPNYTGNTMTLVCELQSINVGEISSVEWTFQGRKIKQMGRRTITNNPSNTQSVLKVVNAIVLDKGLYQCTLMGAVLKFRQKKNVTDIKPAPIIVSKVQLNTRCLGTAGQTQRLKCCVQSQFKVKWLRSSEVLSSTPTDEGNYFCRTYNHPLSSCIGTSITFTCKVDGLNYKQDTTLTTFVEPITCKDPVYGDGREGDRSRPDCPPGQKGDKLAECQQTKWMLLEDTCVVAVIKELFLTSEELLVEDIPDFVGNMSVTVKDVQKEITESPNTISTIVEILGNIADFPALVVSQNVIENVLETVDVIVGGAATGSWTVLNSNGNTTSSDLLFSMESLSKRLSGKLTFKTNVILLNRDTFDNSFQANLNDSVLLDIPNSDFRNASITTITFYTLNNVMPARNSSFNTNSNNTIPVNAINAAVVLVNIDKPINNVTFRYDKLNTSLTQGPQCVFWNFELFNKQGAWDDEGCKFISDVNDTVTCTCDHLTSFSILMATDIPEEIREILDVITYVGVGISMASLVICLIIEGYVWKAITKNSTAFMRHVSIINTALSLLIADICFIIGASIADNPTENPGSDYTVPIGPCSTATFFMHFFYLALFFWMLVSGLLLFYRTVMVFSHMSKSVMLAIGFLLGYGGPLIIAVVTVAATAPGNGYIRKDYACWLNWTETMALLALVIPALSIVFINIIIIIVVLFKMLRRGVGDASQRDERHTLMVILRCVVILTPLFGLTWSLGVGTMIDSSNVGIHIAFAFFNSLQGFFILVFGTLFDSKIRSILARKSPTTSTGSNTTRSTSGGFSSGGMNWINRLRGRRNVYHLSNAANSGSAGASESFSNI